MALLSNTTYNRLAKNFEDSALVLLNLRGEAHKTGSLDKLTRSKNGKINTRWVTEASKNVSPFTHAALTIRNKEILISAIKPIEEVGYGYLDIQYESED